MLEHVDPTSGGELLAAVKPFSDWSEQDVLTWLRLANGEPSCFWPESLGSSSSRPLLSTDYSETFAICGVTGQSLLEMEGYSAAEWDSFGVVEHDRTTLLGGVAVLKSLLFAFSVFIFNWTFVETF